LKLLKSTLLQTLILGTLPPLLTLECSPDFAEGQQIQANRIVHSVPAGTPLAESAGTYPSPATPESVFEPSNSAAPAVTPPVPPAPIIIPDGENYQSYDSTGRVSLSDSVELPAPGVEIDFSGDSEDEDEELQQNLYAVMGQPYRAYRSDANSLGWLPGSGDDFGWLDWVTDPYLDREDSSGLTGAINIHWLSGPYSLPMPPQLFDLSIGYQHRDTISDRFSYDIFASIGLFTDFRDSARDGVRYPSHAVGMFHLDRSTDAVFGVDYISRDDIKLLPVFGMSIRDLLIDDLRLDLIFPRPRIDYVLNDSHRLYLAGYMDGGSWDIEFPDESDHVATYQDLRLTFGFETADDDGDLSSIELGYVFNRSLELRGVPGRMDMDDAFMIRLITRN